MAFDPTSISSQPNWPTPPEAMPNQVLSPLVSGNYVSPEQAQQMRLYANALSNNAMKMPVKNGWQGLAQMANAGIGGLLSNYADKQQRDLVNEGVNRNSLAYSPLDALGANPTRRSCGEVLKPPCLSRGIVT